ncbi:unnamed protein product [Spirodela intermedia]|uniref:GrpE protein homolog n=1 Tax=Spirodela intermedia TaxID=51605 RepID=A0A7I8JGC1_SPIIN|nr:unnamed protein product [Spirodela intermedia]CAA6669189.1 unnamed protein product [Spirodela intermedia]
MATFLATPASLLRPKCRSSNCLEVPKGLPILHLRQRTRRPRQLRLSHLPRESIYLRTLTALCAYGEATETDAVEETTSEVAFFRIDALVFYWYGETDGATVNAEDAQSSAVLASLQSYREALANDDQSTISEIEAFLQSVEDEKNALASKVAALSEELSVEKDRVLRISADFENFRKRTERERLSLMTNAQGKAKAQIKVENEGEEKINNSYQSIYKQFAEVLNSLGVEAVETVGISFDPMLHEAIMREDSTEFEEGIVLQEFRKGFKIGDRLLRPSMVKVSAGPGPAKTEDAPDPVSSRGADQESGEEGAGESA